ncbi:MAG: acetyl-CoA acetyltransferase [Achromobacter mucicolens]|jgi:acetyl-CoA C-acetyltransferase/acetyl-CoA acyltransferase|uniref:thiolase family protein n=1 Tax=Achromobacter mucicolens TaxID=1389922 RepID=UPI00242F9D9A|nr:thiolase family protein [Achromobacter mucicolens]MDF2861277.1 acetyl-CoA acetyltransferase [Achromobacter mucicolens]
MNQAVILEAVRTPFGRRGGWWAETRPDSLLADTVQALLARAGLPGDKVEDLIAGCVSQAGEQGANIGRLAAMLAGLPESVPGVALNRMCGSSQQAVHFGAQAIAAGDMRYVVAGGVESMSRVPMFLDVTLGQSEFRGFESLNPALLARYPLIHQIESAERIASQWGLSQADMDAWARESHARAWAAASAGLHAELLPGPARAVRRDEGIRETTDAARMAAMAPAMRAPGEGGVTAANASQLADGAAAVLLGDKDAALADGLRPRARFLARVVVGSDPVMQLTGVIPAAQQALTRAGLALEDIDWIEINEAFASVVLAWQRELGADLTRVNPWGGAIAHGHPLGATGAGLMAKMLAGLEATEGELGMQLMCIGHGMATATIIQRV